MLAELPVRQMSADARHLVRDLHTPDPRIYWPDMILSACAGWGGFACAVAFRPGSGPMLAGLAISVLALYRGLCFLHELSHLRGGALRGFELAWNIVFGVPLLLPSFVYVGVHQYHHNLATYGTDRDPEYLPFSGKPGMVTVFVLQGLLIPLALLIRFFLLAPLGLMHRGAHRWLFTHASAFCLNPKFRREIQESSRRSVQRWELAIVGAWAMLAGLALHEHMAWRCLAIWYVVSASGAVINIVRTLGAHRYASDGYPLGRDEQLLDSIDTPGAFWTEFWAPVGLRYHALHHYFPGIPYHNLGKAYRRLSANLPPQALYRRATTRGLPHSLHKLCLGNSRSQDHRHKP